MIKSIRPTTLQEDMYTYTQSSQIMSQAGCIGHLRADMETYWDGFFSTWEDHRKDLKTDVFKTEFDHLINIIRGIENDVVDEDDDEVDTFLKSRRYLANWCYTHPTARMREMEDDYGCRIDTEDYTYMFRLNPNKCFYNVYCYCYRRDWLHQHLSNSNRGIRFIDSEYNEKHRVMDGGKIRVHRHDGTSIEFVCRYIDDYHVEIGSTLYHIAEYAEKCERDGDRIEFLR